MNTLHLICSQGDRQRLRQVVDGGEDDAEEQLGHVEDLAAPPIARLGHPWSWTPGTAMLGRVLPRPEKSLESDSEKFSWPSLTTIWLDLSPFALFQILRLISFLKFSFWLFFFLFLHLCFFFFNEVAPWIRYYKCLLFSLSVAVLGTILVDYFVNKNRQQSKQHKHNNNRRSTLSKTMQNTKNVLKWKCNCM